MNALIILLSTLMMFSVVDSEDLQNPQLVEAAGMIPQIDHYLDQCHNLRYSNPDSALIWCKQALALASEIKYEKGEIRAHLLVGILHDVSSQYDSAIYHYRRSLALSHKVGDTLRVASNNNNIGLTFFNMGNLREAMEYFLNSLEYFEQINYSTGVASTYNNLGMIFEELENYQRAVEYYQMALEIRQQMNDHFGEGAALTNIGNVYNKMDSIDSAIQYIRQSIKVKDSIGDLYGLTISNTILAGIYIGEDKLGEAEECLEYAINLSRKMESLGQEINAYLVYQGLYVKRGQYYKAIRMNERSLKLARDIGNLKYQASAYKSLSQAHEKVGNTKKAFEYYKEYIDKKEELVSRERMNQVFHLELQYEREKKAGEIALLNQQAEVNALQIDKQQLLISRRNITIVSIIALFLIAILLAYLFFAKHQAREQLKLNNALALMQKQVARKAIEAEIRERQRIGEELHDSFGQILSLIKLNLTKLQKALEPANNTFGQMLDYSVVLANKAFSDLRIISHNMSPIMLKTKGLALSVKDLLDRIEETNNYKISFEVVDLDENLEPFLEFTLFRTIQELLNNIINHALATEINIQIVKDNNMINIMVEDNGKGFDEQKLDSNKGMGLQNTLSRIKNLNGEMIIDSAVKRGTIITIIVPIEKNETKQYTGQFTDS